MSARLTRERPDFARAARNRTAALREQLIAWSDARLTTGYASLFFYALVSAETEHALELFVRREDAERFSRRYATTTPSLR